MEKVLGNSAEEQWREPLLPRLSPGLKDTPPLINTTTSTSYIRPPIPESDVRNLEATQLPFEYSCLLTSVDIKETLCLESLRFCESELFSDSRLFSDSAEAEDRSDRKNKNKNKSDACNVIDNESRSRNEVRNEGIEKIDVGKDF